MLVWEWAQGGGPGHAGLRAAVLAAGGQAARGPVGRPGPTAVGAIVLLDEHSRPAALLEALLFVVASKLALDQDGRLGHLLIERKLQTRRGKD